MPPQSNMRKSSTQTMAPGESHVNPLVATAVANSAAQPRRTASGRAVRANTTRPTNYYARSFGNGISATDRDNDAADASNTDAAGFFPALQFFTDAITATPKEVIKHFTLLKEVESKILGPQEELGHLIDSLMQQPVPLRKPTTSAVNGGTSGHGLLALTANNSTSGSANVSMINGMSGHHSAQLSLAGSAAGDETAETEAETIRRHQYHGLRALTHSLLGNMDEKNVVLSEANRVLALQHKRLDSVWPHLEQEISEEARMGSMTHWAYSDNRQKTKTTTNAQSRRDGVAATNALANVAAAIHDQEVAQARRDAGREARGEKTRGKRTEHAGDSDFDEKPRKAPKVGKGKAAAGAATGLGISTNGEPATKRRKNAADKQMAPPAMERTTSTTGRGGKVRDTPRSTPVIDPPAKKAPKAKPGPPKGKKVGGSTHNSPMLASSPLASSFNPATMEVPPGAKSQTARLRQNSSTTNLRLQNVALEEEAMTSRPSSSAGKANGAGEKSNGRRKAPETTEEHEDRAAEQTTKSQLTAASELLKREEVDKHDGRGERRQPASRSGSDRDVSRKASGRQSKVGTPRTDSFPDAAGMARSRSTRRVKPANGEGPESDSDEPQTRPPGGSRHKRQQSNSHLVKQLAPFNRSPDLDRHRSGDDKDSDSDREVDEDRPDEGENGESAAERETRRASTRRPLSRRNTINMSPAVNLRDSSPPPSPPPTSLRGNGRSTAASVAAKREAEAEAVRREIIEAETVANVDVEEEEEESEHDPDDPDEPKYCYCNRGSYGEMVACDNDNCPREWFHLGCTELKEAPSEEEKWYCKECRPLFGQKIGRKGKTGRGRGG